MSSKVNIEEVRLVEDSEYFERISAGPYVDPFAQAGFNYCPPPTYLHTPIPVDPSIPVGTLVKLVYDNNTTYGTVLGTWENDPDILEVDNFYSTRTFCIHVKYLTVIKPSV